MVDFKSIFLFDIAAIMLMIIISNLSKRLGEALKIKPYYRIFYATAALIFSAAAMDSFPEVREVAALSCLSMCVRAAACAAAVFTCLPYWKWLFSEYFSSKR